MKLTALLLIFGSPVVFFANNDSGNSLGVGNLTLGSILVLRWLNQLLSAISVVIIVTLFYCRWHRSDCSRFLSVMISFGLVLVGLEVAYMTRMLSGLLVENFQISNGG